MATLHPSNPYYKAAQTVHLPAQNNTIDLLSAISTDNQEQSGPSQVQPLRSQSIATSTPSSHPPMTRNSSTSYYAPRKPPAFRTRSIGGPWGGIYIERDIDLSPPNDDEIIIATVRVTDSFRRASVSANAALPARPPRRNFLKRVSTRVSSPTDTCRYTALKMPRKDYRKYFARDRDGGYAGTEPEREWGEEDLRVMFERFQDMPLRSIPCCEEYGEENERKVGEEAEEGEVKRNDSVMAESQVAEESDLSWAMNGSPGVAEDGRERRSQSVVWPGSIWT